MRTPAGSEKTQANQLRGAFPESPPLSGVIVEGRLNGGKALIWSCGLTGKGRDMDFHDWTRVASGLSGTPIPAVRRLVVGTDSPVRS